LTKKLLTFSRRQVLEQRELHPNTLIRDLEDILRRLIGEQIQTVVVLDPQVGHVLGDAVQLEQVVMNLALNARDAMPDGGILTIETGNVDLDEDYVSLHPGSSPGPHVRISVEDTGHGISSDNLAHIFEPFYSTKEVGKGTGLGLATVYGIVKQSRGYVEVSSQPGRGSRFTALLPRVVTQGGEIELPPAVETQMVSRGSVLVVEDDEGIRNLIGKILTEYGYPVIEASDGVEALKILQTFKGRCDLIIADVIMPRMTGAELVEAVQAFVPDIKVLFVSGYASDTVAANGVGDEPAFLQKPFLPTTLTDKVSELLSVAPSR
jgi:CheY-like chemotaxis protein